MDPHAAKVREIKACLAKEEFKAVLDSMLAKKKKVYLQEFETAEPRLDPHPRVSRRSKSTSSRPANAETTPSKSSQLDSKDARISKGAQNIKGSKHSRVLSRPVSAEEDASSRPKNAELDASSRPEYAELGSSNRPVNAGVGAGSRPKNAELDSSNRPVNAEVGAGSCPENADLDSSNRPVDGRPGFPGNDYDERRARNPSRQQLEGGSDCDGVVRGEGASAARAGLSAAAAGTATANGGHNDNRRDRQSSDGRFLRFQRHRQGAPSSPPRSGEPHRFARPPLLGGRWWSADPGCAVCKTLEMTIVHRSTEKSLAQIFLTLTFRIFLRVLKTDFECFVKTSEEAKLAGCRKGFKRVKRA